MKTAYVFAFLVAASAVAAFDYKDGCKMAICDNIGEGENIANPLDKCSFCCCVHSSTGSYGDFRQCPGTMFYDPVNKNCEGKGCIPAQRCEDMQCPPGIEVFPSPDGPNSFCCCRESSTPETKTCPNNGRFDAAQGRCVGSTRSDRTVTDGCMSLVHLCPIPENMNWVTLFANPLDRRSYCVCDWGKIHWMPCAPGTTFDDTRKVCV